MESLGAIAMSAVQMGRPAPDAAINVAELRGKLTETASRQVDKLTIEIVGLLFDRIHQDKHVPDQIKHLIQRLQFPLIKVAFTDPELFVSPQHPARLLLDRIASTSIGWTHEGEDNRRYLAEVQKAVQAVLAATEDGPGAFEKSLAAFEQYLTEEKTRDDDPVARAKRALAEAESREVMAINAMIQVRSAFDGVQIESYLRDFLLETWVRVLVAASLREKDKPGQVQRYLRVVPDLVWSVQPKASADDRRRLVELIPNLTRVLRDGLALIHMGEREQNEFFGRLMESHAMAVKPVDQARYLRSSLATSELRARLEGMQLTGTFPITTVAGGVRVSTGALMRAAAAHDAELKVPEPVTDIGPLDRVEEARLDEEIASWQRGTWFSMWNGQEMVKARLRWISPLRTLFLFSSDREKNAHVMPPDLIKNYLKRGKLKALEATPLTKRAVDGVVGDFEKLPKRREEMAARYAPAQ